MLTKAIQEYIKNALKVVSDDNIKDMVALTDGRSGAEVYRVKIISIRKRESGTYVIKLLNTESPWYHQYENEAGKSSSIHNNAPLFCDRLVKLCDDSIIDGYHVLLYRQANDSVLNTASLGNLKISEQVQYLKCISFELLQNMNNKSLPDGKVDGLFRDLLSHRLKDGGPFESKITRIVERSSAAAIAIKESVYPNPLYYVCNQTKWLPKIGAMSFFKGNVHGDLHLRNLLCSANLSDTKNLQYSIIDYDSYRSDGYLLFDHAYLELSMYLDSIPDNDLKQWHNTIAPLLKESVFSDVAEEPGQREEHLRNAICSGIALWADKEHSHMKDDIEIQFNMARIAAGINYFSKGAIQKDELLSKILLYIGMCFKNLFDKISFEWNSDDVSRLIYALSKEDSTDTLWENCIRYATSYVAVLVTDDVYNVNNYKRFEALSRIRWSLILDVGSNISPNDISTVVPKKIVSQRNLIISNLLSETESISYTPNSCAFIIAKKTADISSYGVLWIRYQKKIKDLFKQILGCYGLQPFLFVFDSKLSQPFIQKFYQYITEDFERLKGSRFVELQQSIMSEDDRHTLKEYGCHSFSLTNVTLIDIAETAKKYLAEPEISGSRAIVLPALDSNVTLTEMEICHYETSVELVYSGIESGSQYTDFGKTFYRGGEIGWADLANHCDLPLILKYDKVLDRLLKAIEEESPRVKSLRLTHGAGTGGTTLSKRLLWDLKDRVPSMRLKRYSQDTSNILLEIYRKTSKRVFLTVEVGATVISKDELHNLLAKVNEENGKLLVLQVERTSSNNADDDVDATDWKQLATLKDTLPNSVAKDFHTRFSTMTSDQFRQQILNNITFNSDSEWIGQRCPFFYGFYTFVEEYQLRNIERTISECDEKMKALLSDLALITIFSQNICIRYSELPIRLDIDPEVQNPYLFHEKLDSSISKLIVIRESGWRICHPLIAKKIVKEIYGKDNYLDCVFEASKKYVRRIYGIYGEDDSTADNILKELMIDRGYIDSERMKFSPLVEAIQEITKKEQLFRTLIDLYPNNPHYYNHLARLLASKSAADYPRAIELLNTAIMISQENELNLSTHYTTLGCVYSKEMLALIRQERETMKMGRYALNISGLIAEIHNKYIFADDAFISARKHSNKIDNYAYFPNIHMECSLIERIVGYDKHGRSMMELIREESAFRSWYKEHYGKTVQLLAEIERYCNNTDTFIEKAKEMINRISPQDEIIERQLKKWNQQEGQDASSSRRAYVSAIYVRNGYSWDELQQNILRLVEESMRKNLLQNTKNENGKRDIHYWFEAFRRSSVFDPTDAVQYIGDYMTDGYEKEYLLFLLHFLRLEKNISSPMEVVQHINKCKNMVPKGVNDISFRDAYSSINSACPIIAFNKVQRGKGGSIVGLREFQGTITFIRDTSGVIQIDGLSLNAVFIPSFVDENGRKREFTYKNITDRVKFNLMFAYSGLRAWNVDFLS
jgi:hypothetical protein